MKTFLLSVVLLISLIFCKSFSVKAQSVNHWETVVDGSDLWRYHPGDTQPNGDWNQLNFDDSEWAEGKGGIGYGDDDDSTEISPVVSVYMRTKFTIVDKSKIKAALLHVDYDDGYLAYLNGTLIARINVDYNWVNNTTETYASHEALLYNGIAPESIILDKFLLQEILIEGENVLSIEVHNDHVLDDLSSAAFFTVGITDNTSTYKPLPEWFEPPFKLESSTLPIIVINTNKQILREPKITADMGIIYNGEGNVNNITDAFNNYTGKIAIEIRGQSSDYYYPKKSYGLETRDAVGNNRNVSIAGFPSDNDWVLYAPYSDKTFMKDVLTYHWGKQIGLDAPRWKFVEVIINDEYKGIYVLLEKIKQGKNRVDIANLKPVDIAGDQLTGGYIFRIDKYDSQSDPWTSGADNGMQFQSVDPKYSELVTVQKNYIKKFMKDFESALFSNDFKNEETGYRKYIDVKSFVDFMIMNEISKNVDGYTYSTYMYKDRDSIDNKLHMGPLWDFNIGYGNMDYSPEAASSSGWLYNTGRGIPWFDKLMQDDFMKNEFLCQWKEIRSSRLSTTKMLTTIDSIADVLRMPYERDQKRWHTLGVYTWPNLFIGKTYQEEIDELKSWLTQRLKWIDNNLKKECILPPPPVIPVGVIDQSESKISIYPNPSSTTFHIDFIYTTKNEYMLAVYNTLGEKVYMNNTLEEKGFVWPAKDQSGKSINPGLYIVVVKHLSQVIFREKVIKE